MAQNDNNQICKVSAIEYFTEYLDGLLGDEHGFLHDFALIGGDHYYIYSVERLERIKKELIKKYSELL